MKQLDGLSKEEILKRFVSLEFNRFLDYYKDAEDLNYHERSDRGERGERGLRTERGDRSDRGERGERPDRGERGPKSGNRVRLKMNIGDREGIDPKRFLGIINDVTGDKSISIGAIEVTNKFTFFDVFSDQVEKVVTAFAGETEYLVTEAKGSKSFEGGSKKPEYRTRTAGEGRSSGSGEARGSSSYKGGERSYGSRPAATATSGDKPWRNRDASDRGSSRTSSTEGRSSERRSGGSSYKKRY
jgi:ATP-dependent RNA helicase DeaD